MKWSNYFIPTLKEDPQEAEARSHKLMVRSGLIRRLTSGAYIYLPIGLKVLSKVQDIIREEMERAGAIELLMPAIQPTELWKKTGRYGVIGDVMIKYVDRHGKELAFGPTHEEVITDLVSREIRSYKDLPRTLFQIQTKFRDETRPRFGVIRSCEFIMKDAYSFDSGGEGLSLSYSKMYEAYKRIFERCSLDYIPVEADSGMMGGDVSHEFMVTSEIGEDKIVLCQECGYAASTHVASCGGEGDIGPKPVKDMKELEEVLTPKICSVEDVSSFLNTIPETLIKTLLYVSGEDIIAVLIRGDYQANETKIKSYLKTANLELADEKKILSVTGAKPGFTGPIGLKAPIYADYSVRAIVNGIAGANKNDKHYINVNEGRDFKVDKWFDARFIKDSDPCPKCSSAISIKNAIEVGHTFKLGEKYSSSLGARFLDRDGKEKNIVMGCYGIGVNRIIASLIEKTADEKGIVWPETLSPFDIIVIPLNKNDQEVTNVAESVYNNLLEAGFDALLDDRQDKSPGVKFNDADLLGIPKQVIVGKKNTSSGKIEVKERKTGKTDLIDISSLLTHLKK